MPYSTWKSCLQHGRSWISCEVWNLVMAKFPESIGDEKQRGPADPGKLCPVQGRKEKVWVLKKVDALSSPHPSNGQCFVRTETIHLIYHFFIESIFYPLKSDAGFPTSESSLILSTSPSIHPNTFFLSLTLLQTKTNTKTQKNSCQNEKKNKKEKTQRKTSGDTQMQTHNQGKHIIWNHNIQTLLPKNNSQTKPYETKHLPEYHV